MMMREEIIIRVARQEHRGIEVKGDVKIQL